MSSIEHDEGHPHLIDGEFQSDKYPTTPRGKVPLSCKDRDAQDLLWLYAQRRRAVDAEFSADLEIALRNCGYVHGAMAEMSVDPIICGLLARLPKSGDVWPETKRKLWLKLLEGSFDLIYRAVDGDLLLELWSDKPPPYPPRSPATPPKEPSGPSDVSGAVK